MKSESKRRTKGSQSKTREKQRNISNSKRKRRTAKRNKGKTKEIPGSPTENQEYEGWETSGS